MRTFNRTYLAAAAAGIVLAGCMPAPDAQTIDLREPVTIEELRGDDRYQSAWELDGPSEFTIMLPEQTIVVDADSVLLTSLGADVTPDELGADAAVRPVTDIDIKFGITSDAGEAQQHIDTVIDIMHPNDTTIEVLRELQHDLAASAAANNGTLNPADFARSTTDTEGIYTLRGTPIRVGVENVDPDSAPAAIFYTQVGPEGGFWSVLNIVFNTNEPSDTNS